MYIFVLNVGEIKTLMIQLLKAVHHLHDNWILHRDLKTSNLLLSHKGILKVTLIVTDIVFLYRIQWNLAILATLGTNKSGWIRKMTGSQGKFLM